MITKIERIKGIQRITPIRPITPITAHPENQSLIAVGVQHPYQSFYILVSSKNKRNMLILKAKQEACS